MVRDPRFADVTAITAAAARARWLALPVVDLATAMGGRFAVLAPHPDDESLGCGGIIAEACRRGTPPTVIILTDGSLSHPGSRLWPPERLAATRAAEVTAAVRALGLPEERLHRLGLPDGRAPHDAAGIAEVAARVATLTRGCETILTTWRFDPHGDHGSAYKIAAATGLRVLEYPVWGWMLPDEAMLPDAPGGGWRIDVRAHLAAKRAAIDAHRSQLGQVVTDDPDGFAMSTEFLARFAGPFETVLSA